VARGGNDVTIYEINNEKQSIALIISILIQCWLNYLNIVTLFLTVRTLKTTKSLRIPILNGVEASIPFPS